MFKGLDNKDFFKRYKYLFTNFIALSSLQVLNILLPFITIPFLYKIIGVEKVGLLNGAYALAVFSQMVVEYSFKITGTRDVALHANDNCKTSLIFSKIFYTQALLILMALLLQVILYVSFTAYKKEVFVFLMQFGVTVSLATFPIWFFQGIQKMKYVTLINAFFKLVFTVLIFVIVQKETDYWKVPLLTFLGCFLSTFFGYLMVFMQFKVKLLGVSIFQIKEQLKEGFVVFISDLQTGSISNLAILFIGFFKGDYAVGIYSFVDKLIRAISSLQLPLINTFFPFFASKSSNQVQNTYQNTLKIMKWGLFAISIGLAVLFFMTEFVLEFVFHQHIADAVVLFKMFLVFPLFYFINQILSKLFIAANGMYKLYAKVVFINFLLNMILLLFLTHKFSYFGSVFAVVAVEVVTSVGLYIYLKNKHENIS